MKLKNLLLMTALAVSSSSFAAEYYVVPGNTATGNDGSSWEKAITIWDIYANEATAKKVEDNSKYKNGDVFYFASGVYYPTLTAGGVPQRIYRGYIFVGGCDPTKGAVTEWPQYPVDNPTIFSGDLNGDGIASPGDAKCLVYMRLGSNGINTDVDRYTITDNLLKPLTFHGFEFKCAYNETEWPKSEGANELTGFGAICTIQGWCELYNCNVHDNYSAKAAGFHAYGSIYNLVDCSFYNNVAKQTGAAVRININTDARYSRGTIDRCNFYNNILEDKYGAAIALTAGELYIINSTISGNTAYAEGAGVVANGDKNATRKLHIINSTIAGNYCTADPSELYKTDTETGTVTNPGSLVGTELRIASDANFEMFNSIVVGRYDDGSVSYAPIVMKDAEKGEPNHLFTPKCDFINFNLTGTYLPLIESERWSYIKEGLYNNMNAANTYSAVFGDQDITVNSQKIIIPRADYLKSLQAKDYYPAYVSDAITFAKELASQPLFATTGFKVPDLTVDQTGAKRNTSDDQDYCVGAYDIYSNTTGITSIHTEKTISDNTIYNMTGQRVGISYKGLIIKNGKKIIIK